ncbi:hypothetical protein HT031_004151 [Scenedesmus sp. PABB004]|nr:hypothetical protein HT031_004151 [Scenedesmus sp. PABB004]
MQSQGAHWTAFLDKLAVINMTHMQIMAEVRPLLRQYIIYPKFVDNPGIENSIPELLASRLLPEQVEQEAAWRAAMPGGLAQLAAQPNVALEYAEGQVVELQDLVGWLTSLHHVLKSQDLANPTPRDLPAGVLDPKGKLRRDVDAMSREITLAATAAAAAREQAGGSLAGAHQAGVTSVVVVGQKRARPGAPAQQQQQPAEPPGGAAKSESDQLLAKIVSGELWPRMGAGR